jgi:hypothetical protein
VSVAARPATGGWHVQSGDPFLASERTPAGVDPAGLSRYGAERWILGALNRRAHRNNNSINWALCPQPLRETLRRAGWLLINQPTPDVLLEQASRSRAEQMSGSSIDRVITNWRRFANWLHERQITSLSQVDNDLMADYASHVASLRRSESTSRHALYAVSLLWAFAPHLPPDDRIPMPPWEAQGTEQFLPTDLDINENATPPIHPAAMSPLLIWAMRFVQDFADDIIAAWAERERLLSQVTDTTNTTARPSLKALFDHSAASGTPLPGQPYADGRWGLANTYLAGLHATSIAHVKNLAARYRGRLTIGTAAPLHTPISGRLHARAWREAISFHEAPTLMSMLATACLVVACYLSGARPGEILNLKTGCCQKTATGDTIRYQLHGDFFKGARDPDGQPAPDGTPRPVPWTVIAPVASAVGILQRLAHTDLLFPAHGHWMTTDVQRPDWNRHTSALTCQVANTRIARFISAVNAFASTHGLEAERVPDDPDGPVLMSRFRRTIAWHIARLPGGRIALAIQYGHLRTVTSEGYSGRARHSLRTMVDFETARTMADHLTHVAEQLRGEHVSGPAAGRLVAAAHAATARFNGIYLSPKDAAALLAEPLFQVYDNPQAFLTCNYDPTKALCDPDRDSRRQARRAQPSLDRCDAACANIARTDTHIDLARREAARRQILISDPLTPQPLRERHCQRVGHLHQLVNRHERTRPAGGDQQ